MYITSNSVEAFCGENWKVSILDFFRVGVARQGVVADEKKGDGIGQAVGETEDNRMGLVSRVLVDMA